MRKTYRETGKNILFIEKFSMIILILLSVFSFVFAYTKLNKESISLAYKGEIILTRDHSKEDYDEDNRLCDVFYGNEEYQLILSYTYEDYLKLDNEEIMAFVYQLEDGHHLLFDHFDPVKEEIKTAYKSLMADELMPLFNLASSSFILLIAIAIVYFYASFFTGYEKCWFISVLFLAMLFSVLFPEESANGFNGVIIMLLYLLDTFFNVLCELLISKQSRYNFLVSILVEITEILICLLLMYRFATMATTLLFWLPIDIISFINWSKHKDEKDEELTIVRKLKGYQEVLIIVIIVIWTFVVGYFISGLNIKTDFFIDKELATLIIYLDACASAVGIANGLFILFRLREQWLAWYLCAALETVINILSGQYVLLVLKLAYFTNTTYGYLKWSEYISARRDI